MKFRFSVLIAACGILASCQSDADVRSKPPLATYTTAKGVDSAVACLGPSLGSSLSAAAPSNFRFVAQVIVPGREYDLVPTSGVVNGHYVYTVNVQSTPNGSRIKLFQGQFMLPTLTNAVKSGIAACL